MDRIVKVADVFVAALHHDDEMQKKFAEHDSEKRAVITLRQSADGIYRITVTVDAYNEERGGFVTIGAAMAVAGDIVRDELATRDTLQPGEP